MMVSPRVTSHRSCGCQEQTRALPSPRRDDGTRDAAEQLCFPNPSIFQPWWHFLEPNAGVKCEGPAIKPRGELRLHPRSERGAGARRGHGEAFGEPRSAHRGGSLGDKVGPSPWGTGDTARAFSPPETSKSLSKTRVSLWTYSSYAHTYAHPFLLCPVKYSCFLSFLGRRLQISRRSGCCHGNSRCRNSFGLSLGNPSWSCQAIGSRGGTRDFGRGGMDAAAGGDCQEHLEWDHCLPPGRDGSCQVQSRVLGRIMVGRALAIKPQPLPVWSEPSPPIPTTSPLAPNPALPSCAEYPQHWAASSALC